MLLDASVQQAIAVDPAGRVLGLLSVEAITSRLDER